MLAAGADGIHVGRDDLDPATARRLLGPRAIIGVSIKNESDVAKLPVGAVDYACIGGVFATGSKDNPDPPIGLDGLRRLRELLRARAPQLPVGAIAGITEENAAAVIGAGAEGIAVISAVIAANDAEAAARRLRALVDAARSKQGAPHDGADRAHHRGLRLERRRRHPGGSQDVLGARRLWRLGDHRAHRAEHARRGGGVRRSRRFRRRCKWTLFSPISTLPRPRSACCRAARRSRRWRRASTVMRRKTWCSIR